MKTSDLIDTLTTKLSPTRTVPLYRYVATAMMVGTVLSVVLALAGLGPRVINSEPELVFVIAKASFAVSIIVVGAFLVVRASVPGRARPGNYLLALVPLVLVVLIAIFDLLHVSPRHLHERIFGEDWLLCLFAIPVIAIVPYALIVLTIRIFAAPTDLMCAGAFAGMTSGGISALAYAIHCTDDSVIFIASWYVVAVSICTLLGAFVGPRIMRW